VSAAVDGGRVRIIVQDNGAGLQSGDIYSRSLGNIRKRLWHYFEDIEFSVLNIEAGGVEVIISYCYKKTRIIAEIR
jgi:LytS/YehU family sensor histidine kinase